MILIKKNTREDIPALFNERLDGDVCGAVGFDTGVGRRNPEVGDTLGRGGNGRLKEKTCATERVHCVLTHNDIASLSLWSK